MLDFSSMFSSSCTLINKVFHKIAGFTRMYNVEDVVHRIQRGEGGGAEIFPRCISVPIRHVGGE